MKTKDLIPSVDNFLCALSYSYHVDRQELYAAVADMATRELNRLQGLDPARNRSTIAG
jgi:hypothetical protein